VADASLIPVGSYVQIPSPIVPRSVARFPSPFTILSRASSRGSRAVSDVAS